MKSFFQQQVEDSRRDLELRVFDKCIIYRGKKFNYTVSEEVLNLEIKTANILIDGASYQFNLTSKDFHEHFVTFFNKIPKAYTKKVNEARA